MLEYETTPLAENSPLKINVTPPINNPSSDSNEKLIQMVPIEESKTVSVFDFPVSVFDVAAYILGKTGTISTIKLQKLVYYCQAWSLVWDDAPLFCERIEAWVNGPVVRELFAFHRGAFLINAVPIGVPAHLSKTQRETIDAVIKFYGKRTGQELVEMSHLEEPWKIARKGLDPDERGVAIISNESMAEYYTSISVK